MKDCWKAVTKRPNNLSISFFSNVIRINEILGYRRVGGVKCSPTLVILYQSNCTNWKYYAISNLYIYYLRKYGITE